MWMWLTGMKTYIVAFATVLYALVQYWNGAMSVNAAVAMVVGALGMAALRHGVSTTLLAAVTNAVQFLRASDAAQVTRKVAPLLFLCVMAGMALTACASVTQSAQSLTAPSVATSLNQIGSFTITDLQNADAMAVAKGDAMGDACFKGLIGFVQTQQAQVNGAASQTVSGAFSAFEAGRLAVNSATGLVSAATLQPLETACGPLVVDTENQPALFLGQLAALGIK